MKSPSYNQLHYCSLFQSLFEVFLYAVCNDIMQVLQTSTWISRAWTNNNAESYNHVLKTKTSWKSLKRVSDLIDHIHGLVKVQLKDLRRALHGDGNFVVSGPFRRHLVSYQAWQGLTADRRNTLYTRFLSDTGSRVTPPTVSSTDGCLTVLNTSTVACKPGQRKRPRATTTTTSNKR